MTRLPRALAEVIARQTEKAEWTPKEAVKIRRLSLSAYKLGVKHGRTLASIERAEQENADIDHDLAQSTKGKPHGISCGCPGPCEVMQSDKDKGAT